MLDGLRGESSITDLCRREGLYPNHVLQMEQGFSGSRQAPPQRRYQESGYNGLALNDKNSRQVWDTIPDREKERVVDIARRYPEKSSREIACLITDGGSFISESSVYRILKSYDLVTCPVYTVISAKDRFENPTSRINELWQTDFTYFKVKDWGWYYLSTVMDDCSRYILAWRLCRTMKAEDVKETLDMAIERTGVKHVHVVQRPRLLSDNGPAYVARETRAFAQEAGLEVCTTPYYSSESNGMAEAFVKTFKRDYVRIHDLPNAEAVLRQIPEWFEDYCENHPHKGLKMMSPREYKKLMDRVS